MILTLVSHAATPEEPVGKDSSFGGIASAPEGSLLIERAPAPLYRDPIFDGATDPSVVFEESDGSWLDAVAGTQPKVAPPCGTTLGFDAESR